MIKGEFVGHIKQPFTPLENLILRGQVKVSVIYNPIERYLSKID